MSHVESSSGMSSKARPGLAGAFALLSTLFVLVAASAIAAPAGAHTRHRAAARTRAPSGDRKTGRRARGPAARAAIVDGTQIAIAQAPWQVAVFAEFEGDELLCGGSIISPTEILTAAHCVYSEATNQRIPAPDFEVLAGTANLFASEPTLQERLVSSVRPHPYYHPTEALPRADDVAVLTLATPLTETAGSAQKLALSASGVGPEDGAAVALTGFGAQDGETQALDGKLYAISMTTAFRFHCGGESDALYVCASTPTGSLCSGDSGSALTLPGSPATAIGVTDTVQVIGGVPCRPGAGGGFADLAAPEIRDFLQGSESPPRAPRGGGDISIRGVPRSGSVLTCQPGTWINSPTFTYAFIDSQSGTRLQSGLAQTYTLTNDDAGRTIFCEVQAANAGGTGALRTGSLQAISAASGAGTSEAAAPGAAPQAIAPPATPGKASRITLRATSISVSRSGDALVRLACVGVGQCSGRLSLTIRRTVVRRGRRTVRIVSLALPTAFSLAQGRSYTVALRLTSLGRALLASAHGHLAARLTTVQVLPAPRVSSTETVRLARARKS
jgi:hypothetical protein